MVAISVIVIAIVAALFVFVPPFEKGMKAWSQDFTSWYGGENSIDDGYHVLHRDLPPLSLRMIVYKVTGLGKDHTADAKPYKAPMGGAIAIATVIIVFVEGTVI